VDSSFSLAAIAICPGRYLIFGVYRSIESGMTAIS
jgi:hypothetical protein